MGNLAPLYCTECGEEVIWSSGVMNRCTCGGRRFSMTPPSQISYAKPSANPKTTWREILTQDDIDWLKSAHISPA